MLYENMSWMDIIPDSQKKVKSVIGKYKQICKDDSKKSCFLEMCISSLFYVDFMTTREKGIPCFGLTYIVGSDGILTVHPSQREYCLVENACDFEEQDFYDKEIYFILETCNSGLNFPHTQTLTWEKVLTTIDEHGQTTPFVVPYVFAFDQNPAKKAPEDLTLGEKRFLWGEDIILSIGCVGLQSMDRMC